ncbi:hypothetical protein L3X37_09370 [Sabulilitoribacter arenilitoris]|uniref:Uncharacterized protein n=1 Tax=Wocania arenilitoris TaxID=2044858 RepID=A0AAE3ENB2_9FLAO|nr:hypothetical protein [Wocania arenilitoris]MCF7568573.1 hypothetical protein [Wocania arenilitoris]
MKDKKLHNIKSTGFEVPKGYFDAFEENLLNKISKEENTLNVNSNGFKTPEGYFDSLEERIIQNLSEEKETKVIPLINRKTIIYISSIAAAVLLLFNLSIFESSFTVGDLETETVENYVIDENISSYEIASLLTEDELNEDNLVDYNFEEENIEEYLLNNADIEELLIE